METSLETLLLIHCAVVSVVLAVAWRLLARRGLFHWLTAGFWAWVAFTLYFVVNPFFSVLEGDLDRYDICLTLAGGFERWLWILVVIIAGITVFFLAYLRTTFRPVTFQIKPIRQITPTLFFVMLVFIGLGLWFLILFRSNLYEVSGIMIRGGRFVGAVTGWQYSGHKFLFVPTVFLMLSNRRGLRMIGLLLGLAYIILALPNAGARFATLSMLLVMILAHIKVVHRRWPSWPLILLLVLMAGMFVLRGHTAWSLGGDLKTDITEKVIEIPGKIGSILSSQDTRMLATLYFESYYVDTLTGYNYGLQPLNYLLLGWVPTRFFPHKYFMLKWIQSLHRTPPVWADQLLYGAKSSMVGAFYCMGNIVAVIIGMWIMGFLSRRLDGMLAEGTPCLVQALALSWMGNLWMIWGSNFSWGLINVGTTAVPALAMWFVSRKGISAMNPVMKKGHYRLMFRRGYLVDRRQSGSRRSMQDQDKI